MAKAKSDKIMFYGTGRRKKSIARVRLEEFYSQYGFIKSYGNYMIKEI